MLSIYAMHALLRLKYLPNAEEEAASCVERMTTVLGGVLFDWLSLATASVN